MLNVRSVAWLTALAAASPLVACAPAYTTVAATYPVAYPVTYAVPAAVPVAVPATMPASVPAVVTTAAVAAAVGVTPVYSTAPVATVAPSMVVNRAAFWP
jgi:hypothetical protein